ncbi:MAG: hypothetical protein JKY17_08630 [Magnetovibrio sp.]|nr:hypothetical protein [Magnetovibrio sp.]
MSKCQLRTLTKDECAYNHALSKLWVRVEHSTGPFKRFRILSERYRYPINRYAAKISTVPGLFNIQTGF